jgi:hypothetical protein
MESKRFGRKLKLPATAAIKHQMRVLMLEDLIAADAREAAVAIALQPTGAASHEAVPRPG